MSLSANIKRLRLEKNLTQEQLATKLGVSAQAVSKWETSETYPDGALLVPLANELEVSFDELFGNETITMADVSGRIVKLIHNTEAKERFNVVRDIGWQIERGLLTVLWKLKRNTIQMKSRIRKTHPIFLMITDLQSYRTEKILSFLYFPSRQVDTDIF